jgi:hypothetical protein
MNFFAPFLNLLFEAEKKAQQKIKVFFFYLNHHLVA